MVGMFVCFTEYLFVSLGVDQYETAIMETFVYAVYNLSHPYNEVDIISFILQREAEAERLCLI